MIAQQIVMGVPLKVDVGVVKVGFIKSSNMLCSRSIAAMKSDINIEALIRETWLADERLKRLMALILSVPSIGEVTALQNVLTTNKFKSINTAKKFSYYSGVEPFKYKTGTLI